MTIRITYRAMILSSLLLIGAVPGFASRIIDERVHLTRSGECGTVKQISFAGQVAVIEGAMIKAASGQVLYTAPEAILDAASKDGIDYVLTVSALAVKKEKKFQLLKLGNRYTSGRLLFTQPDLVIYYVTAANGTLFFTHSAKLRRLYFAAGDEFVTARLDQYGNTIIAYQNQVSVVNKHGQVVPLLAMQDDRIERMEIMPTDNSMLLGTEKGLFKVPRGGKFYTLLLG